MWQRERANSLPGLTGYWQVNGKNKTTFTEMIEMDIFYTKNLSLWLDLTIILRTVPAIVMQVLESRIRRLRLGAAAKSSSNLSVAKKCL
jgi:lipopolysaccharide/colanic/teichoic acid biosynthesis glycosyltransferase